MMKVIFTILITALLITTIFSGCSGKKEEIPLVDKGNNQHSYTKRTEQVDTIVLSEKITELADGLSAVRHTGDYGFDDFLAKGGASSDAEVVSFLMKHGIRQKF